MAFAYGMGVTCLQLLRTRRPFVAYITDALGNELFRVRSALPANIVSSFASRILFVL